MRDYAALLAGDRCWDAEVQALYAETGEPRADCILQSRAELLGLCAFIEAQGVRSYLEIGAWTGRLASALHRVFAFDVVAVCDDRYAERLGLPIAVPADARCFWGDSGSDAFRQWRAELGHIDLVLIDANHSYAAVKRDFELNRSFPHRFLALHDITGANRHTRGVERLWGELGGWKHEIALPNPEAGLARSEMGIGIWAAQPPAPTWLIQAQAEQQVVDQGTRALAMDLDPRRRLLELGVQIKTGGGQQFWSNAVIRRLFSGDRGDWRPALAWLAGAEAKALLGRISAGYRAEMVWTGDWVGEWDEDAWAAMEALTEGIAERL